jgi:hypothetical protein
MTHQPPQLPPLPSDGALDERIKTLMLQAGLPESQSVYSAFMQFKIEMQHAMISCATAAVQAALSSQAPAKPLGIFAHGPWVYRETGEEFTGAQLDFEAFQLYGAALQFRQPAAPVRMSDELRDFIEGMSVSVDVSTGGPDSGHRYMGTVTEVMDDPEDKHGVTLLVQDAKPNFAAPVAADVVDEICHLLTETWGFAATPPKGKDNLGAALDLLDKLNAVAPVAVVPEVALSDEQINHVFDEHACRQDEDGCHYVNLYRPGFRGVVREVLALASPAPPVQQAQPENQATGLPYTEWVRGDILRVVASDRGNDGPFELGQLVEHADEDGDRVPYCAAIGSTSQHALIHTQLEFVSRPGALTAAQAEGGSK